MKNAIKPHAGDFLYDDNTFSFGYFKEKCLKGILINEEYYIPCTLRKPFCDYPCPWEEIEYPELLPPPEVRDIIERKIHPIYLALKRIRLVYAEDNLFETPLWAAEDKKSEWQEGHRKAMFGGSFGCDTIWVDPGFYPAKKAYCYVLKIENALTPFVSEPKKSSESKLSLLDRFFLWLLKSSDWPKLE